MECQQGLFQATKFALGVFCKNLQEIMGWRDDREQKTHAKEIWKFSAEGMRNSKPDAPWEGNIYPAISTWKVKNSSR